jgi:DNA topoisomerase VI subunit B
VRYVYDHQGSEEALRVLRYFLDNIDSWNEESIRKLTINQFLNNLAGQVSSLTGLPRDDVRTELAHFSKTDNLTRQWSKYVMGSLRLPGTPYK